MNVFTRIQRGLRAGVHAFRTTPDFRSASRKIDEMIANKSLQTVEKQNNPSEDDKSKLDVRHTDRDIAYYSAMNILRSFVKKGDECPVYATLDRDIHMSEIWMDEPILAGAVYSMVAKMTALSWSVTGRKRVAKTAAEMFATAAHMDGYDWGGFISSTANDFFTTDRGSFWETPRDNLGHVTDLGHIDSLSCTLTGNKKRPMVYMSEVTGQTIRFKYGEYIHFASLPSSRERYLGIGFCAVSRAYRAAKLLLGLHDYDEEKLDNLPPEGIAAITGLTMDEFVDAVNLWKAKRESDNSLTFPQVLWLLGSQPNVEVKVAIQGFSQLPESFERKTVVDQYVNTLALAFGVDAREFWPISSGSLGTASESEIQHQKARGKGPGEFISITERHLNGELPDDAEMRYDTQDIEEDFNSAKIAGAWIDAFWPLYEGVKSQTTPPSPQSMPGTKAGQQEGQPAGKRADRVEMKQLPVPAQQNGNDQKSGQVINKEQLLRLLIDKGVLPDYLANDQRIAIRDADVRIRKDDDVHDEDYISYVWKDGVLSPRRLAPIVINTRQLPDGKYVPDAILKTNGNHREREFDSITDALKFLETKEDEVMALHRNIKGEPIPEGEVGRGSSTTAKTIKSELERWRKHPILSKYALSAEEEELLVKGLRK
ncbi:MAG TPA: hypothetical protein VJ044_14155 [Candidatus Hodarchaeales archaeon]|nr:hypothetical protein [Candidatus Hodarchaeales archaeon]